jgi:hypothetical protein
MGAASAEKRIPTRSGGMGAASAEKRIPIRSGGVGAASEKRIPIVSRLLQKGL